LQKGWELCGGVAMIVPSLGRQDLHFAKAIVFRNKNLTNFNYCLFMCLLKNGRIIKNDDKHFTKKFIFNSNHMRHYPKYLIKTGDEFDSFNFPQITKDLNEINAVSVNLPCTLKAEILISYTKDHSLKNEWISANQEFAELVTTGALPIGNIVSLFEASSKNSFFQQQFEKFILESFNN
jgi:hypothetical protein